MSKQLEFPYQHILVLGLARSGTATAKTLLKNNKQVRVNDKNTANDAAEVVLLRELGAEVIVGSHPLSLLEGIELIIKNPGIPYSIPLLEEAEQRGIPIVTEIELAYQLVPGNLIGITGSNGKTTTTTLTTEMLRESERPVKVAGNIGIVATEAAEELTAEETLVLELSSFQLQGTISFRPNIAVILNIFASHLDYHKSMDNYKQAKFNIFKNQNENDYLIYNADDKAIVEKIEFAKAQRIPFSTNQKLPNGAWVDDSFIYFKDEKVIARNKVVLVGDHNLENILAAIAAAKLAGATNEGIEKVLSTFQGVKHRLQFVEKINDRLFYNDSKATNMLATQKALRSFNQPVILLAGGLDRGDNLDELLPYLNNVKALVSFGETKEKFRELAEKAGIELTETTDTILQAVKTAYEFSDMHDVILLSPACASWDQYRTFEERGDIFIESVHKLL
ncbi:UDP-N-acetylmuramoyl-L-alanine--D-glutamate ligase [Oceanobacillus sp. CAU 1775]